MSAGNRNPSSKGLSFLDAAAEVLQHAGAPLSVQEILTEARRRRLLKSRGKTPDRTLASALYVDMRKNQNTRFVRLSEKGPVRAVRNSVRWALKKRRRRQP